MNKDRFIVSVFTPTIIQEDEAKKIIFLLKNGIDFVHLRHPDTDLQTMHSLLSSIPANLHNSLIIHDHFCLANRFVNLSVQINSRNPIAPENVYNVTKSCHSVDEIETAKNLMYATLSPIYPSISKPGYSNRPNLDGLASIKIPVIALGGVTPDKFEEIQKYGFSGAALLGYMWDNKDSFENKAEIILKHKNICCNS